MRLQPGKMCCLIICFLLISLDTDFAHFKRELSRPFRLIDIVGNLRLQMKIVRSLQRQLFEEKKSLDGKFLLVSHVSVLFLYLQVNSLFTNKELVDLTL